ncbi:MAG TPA: hemerythrin domain-containing protein [Thermoguttaceae bacterium]|nr:hemerythrin domain-containing protein [Thermoguttaceae bacterium]HPP54221.1 hemerythrin domain-containing protein [Thermoguttaceae bacterium]
MKPTDLLRSEHRVIEQMLSVLEKLGSLPEDQPIDQADAQETLEFFRRFADRCHHGKEEGLLFPALERKGFPREMGPIGVMLYEHDIGRSHIRSMAEALQRLQSGQQEARTMFCQHARAYIDLLREHIYKEDNILFMMAEQAFSPQDQQQLLEEFHQTEQTAVEAGEHERWIQAAHQLADKYGLPRTAERPSSCCGSHSR